MIQYQSSFSRLILRPLAIVRQWQLHYCPALVQNAVLEAAYLIVPVWLTVRTKSRPRSHLELRAATPRVEFLPARHISSSVYARMASKEEETPLDTRDALDILESESKEAEKDAEIDRIL